MKKILISIIGILIVILIFVSAFKGISIGKISVYSVKNIKQKNSDLDNKIQEAGTQINQVYRKSVADIEMASKNLKELKKEYQSMLGINGQLGITEIEKYKIEYLWWLIGDYAAEEGLRLYLDVQETTLDDTYNIAFTLYGSYVGINNFLYHIEKDDNLNYRPENFNIKASVVSELPGDLAEIIIKKAKEKDEPIPVISTDILTSTFVVENVIINFD